MQKGESKMCICGSDAPIFWTQICIGLTSSIFGDSFLASRIGLIISIFTDTGRCWIIYWEHFTARLLCSPWLMAIFPRGKKYLIRLRLNISLLVCEREWMYFLNPSLNLLSNNEYNVDLWSHSIISNLYDSQIACVAYRSYNITF